MIYELRHCDVPLMRFTATEDTSSPEIEILWVNEEKKALLPLDMNTNGDSVSRWLRHRTIPKNRAYVHSFLSKCGLNLNRPMSILSVSKGLSLNDCYWVVEEGFEGCFAEYNLYENRFSRVLGLIAFTGYGSSVRTSLASCPEFTTNGMLPKCWRRENGIIRLYKGSTSGASNTGNEPYSEFYAAQIAEVLGINAIPYGLSKWQGELCSTCELFTSKEHSFIPVGRLVTKGGMKAVREYYESLGEEFIHALDDMLVLDAIICNVDRHFGNFGFMVDNRTNKITAPAHCLITVIRFLILQAEMTLLLMRLSVIMPIRLFPACMMTSSAQRKRFWTAGTGMDFADCSTSVSVVIHDITSTANV